MRLSELKSLIEIATIMTGDGDPEVVMLDFDETKQMYTGLPGYVNSIELPAGMDSVPYFSEGMPFILITGKEST